MGFGWWMHTPSRFYEPYKCQHLWSSWLWRLVNTEEVSGSNPDRCTLLFVCLFFGLVLPIFFGGESTSANTCHNANVCGCATLPIFLDLVKNGTKIKSRSNQFLLPEAHAEMGGDSLTFPHVLPFQSFPSRTNFDQWEHETDWLTYMLHSISAQPDCRPKNNFRPKFFLSFCCQKPYAETCTAHSELCAHNGGPVLCAHNGGGSVRPYRGLRCVPDIPKKFRPKNWDVVAQRTFPM